jgi:hypothetical protein
MAYALNSHVVIKILLGVLYTFLREPPDIKLFSDYRMSQETEYKYLYII